MPRRSPGISKYETSDGRTRWQYVMDHGDDAFTGKRRQIRKRGFATVADAEKALADARRAIEQGTYVEPSRTTFGTYLASWLDTRAVTGLQPKTASSYKQLVVDYINPAIGHIPLQKLGALT